MAVGVSWLKTNMVALYHFDGNSTDVTGNHNGTDTDITYVLGGYNQCASFNGTSSVITMGDHADWNFGSGDFTIAFRVKMGATGTTEFINQAVDGSNKWSFYYSSGSWNWLIESGGTNIINWSFTPTIGLWYWVTLTRIGNEYEIYINEVSYGAKTLATAVPDLAGSLRVGAGYDGASTSNFLNGFMDELFIYKGTGLTKREAVNHYAWASGKLSRIV